MARLESAAIAGYYPTPGDQLPLIARVLTVGEKLGEDTGRDVTITAVDPCAGDGEAVQTLVRLVRTRGLDAAIKAAKEPLPDEKIAQRRKEIEGDFNVDLFTCEMEHGRHKALRERLQGTNWHNERRALHGDAFHVMFDRRDATGAGLLFVNAPYDTDREKGRVEERFLERFTEVLAPGGVLVYVLPYYALSASVRTLASRYQNVACRRFAGDAFNAYKQVVIFAERSLNWDTPDPRIVADVERWAASADSIPELSLDTDLEYGVPTSERYSGSEAIASWTLAEMDLTGLVSKFAPWCETTRARGLAPSPRVLPDLPIADLMHRTYEVATPPRPAHIAAGIAAGLFNGRRVVPDDSKSALPPLLVKGVFDREWRTVEEKHNKDGEKTGEVQVQQPKLVVTILDLNARTFYTIESRLERAKEDLAKTGDASKIGVADLLGHYGQSLMSVMEQQCKVLYDPRKDAEQVELVTSPRRMYAAQAHAARACVKLLRERPGRHPILLGEIGSGKTTVALNAARAVGARRVLAVCPPHLLDSWRNEVASVWPEADVMVLKTISDVEAVKSAPSDRAIVAVLSRETAKLGHGWVSVGADCPACGAATPNVDLAKKRARCEARTLFAKDDYAELARRVALLIRPHVEYDQGVANVLRGRMDRKRRRKRGDDETLPPWPGLSREFARELRVKLMTDYVNGRRGESMQQAIAVMHLAAPDADALLHFMTLAQDKYDHEQYAGSLALLLAGEDRNRARAIVASFKRERHYHTQSPVEYLDTQIDALDNEKYMVRTTGLQVSWQDGKLMLVDRQAESVEAASWLLSKLIDLGSWGTTPECGEPLYQAVPEPRRYPLAQHIVYQHKELFDFLLLDEGHEYATEGSAQERAAHRLTTLGLPTICMSGSIMNGYASSLFTNMWALSPEFREEFDRGDGSPFVDRYGYRKQLVQDREDGEVIAFGSQSDRVQRSERDVGDAPGVLPLFLFRHLLPSAVTIHKADLRIELPTCTQQRFEIAAEGKLLDEYKRLLEALKKQISHDRFEPDVAGKLFGALSELPSFLDRATADVGNCDDGYEIRYPESVGGGLVATAKMLPASSILPKEQWMLDTLESELAEGRNVMVFAWHVSLLPRLQRLIQKHLGVEAPILHSDKVPTAKRQAWIDKEIVKKKRRVLIANPVSVQTGLNNLVHFATEIWHENPACNPIVYRQANGRVDRIGQRLPTRILFAHYRDTLQAQMYELLMAKVAISTATDGLDPESALRASGIAEDEMLTGLSIGKQLWAMIADDFSSDQPRSNGKRKVRAA